MFNEVLQDNLDTWKASLQWFIFKCQVLKTWCLCIKFFFLKSFLSNEEGSYSWGLAVWQDFESFLVPVGWKCRSNTRPGVIVWVPAPAAIKKSRGVWQQRKQGINQSLSNFTEWGKQWDQSYGKITLRNRDRISVLCFISILLKQ